jgi:hypothetical protein
VPAFIGHPVDGLAAEKLDWHADVISTDLPINLETKHGSNATVPESDFADNPVLRSSPRGPVGCA